ncbi:hypothetical protein TNCT_474651 [Trichonephila clavata]|uniref:Uncharacterized protein n=1 Tax=Trichonephila clavata TaxID=2740835 RepID=A0A8X6FSQ3_TRICU|nr:hypothetical protein TNCT_579571 [Trichonephila clavata]GFR10682.1 hypothetical protein TNCT_474651 [Trichonephila clavata]
MNALKLRCQFKHHPRHPHVTLEGDVMERRVYRENSNSEKRKMELPETSTVSMTSGQYGTDWLYVDNIAQIASKWTILHRLPLCGQYCTDCL